MGSFWYHLHKYVYFKIDSLGQSQDLPCNYKSAVLAEDPANTIPSECYCLTKDEFSAGFKRDYTANNLFIFGENPDIIPISCLDEGVCSNGGTAPDGTALYECNGYQSCEDLGDLISDVENVGDCALRSLEGDYIAISYTFEDPSVCYCLTEQDFSAGINNTGNENFSVYFLGENPDTIPGCNTRMF